MYNSAFFIYTGKRVLLLRKRQGRYKHQWSSPGGHIEWGETPKEGAIRELKEETKIDYYSLNGKITSILRQHHTRIYVMKVKNIPTPVLSKEHDAYALVSFKDIDNFALTPYFEEIWHYIKENKLI